MIHVVNVLDNIKLFEALANPVRLRILNLLRTNGNHNLSELANELKLSNTAMTTHINKLVEGGLVNVRLVSLRRGIQKLCSLTDDKILIELLDFHNSEKSYETELDVGQYTDYNINPTCGLANDSSLIGELDLPQCFSYPERFNAHVIWFTEGFVEYKFPNRITLSQTPVEMQFSFEISGEAPGASENFPSDIRFFANDKYLCSFDVPGEFFTNKGRFTPDWWFKNFGQYGLLKILSVNSEGTFLDGIRVGDVCIEDFILAKSNDLTLKISCEDQSRYSGGITLFGRNFGNYNQGIKLKLIYK